MQATETTTYDIRLLSTGDKIGSCKLTAEKFAKYERLSQQPEGTIVLADLMDGLSRGNEYDAFDLASDDQDTKVVVWLE